MPESEYRQQGTDLPKGSATQLDEALDVAASAPDSPAPSTNASIDESELPEVNGAAPDETDEVLFGPTDHPNRPLTHGVPIGPGQDFVVTPRMSDRALLTRAATRIVESKDSVPTDALTFAVRVLAGE